MRLNIIIEVEDSRERYMAENKLSPFKFVVVVRRFYEFSVFLAVSLAKFKLTQFHISCV